MNTLARGRARLALAQERQVAVRCQIGALQSLLPITSPTRIIYATGDHPVVSRFFREISWVDLIDGKLTLVGRAADGESATIRAINLRKFNFFPQSQDN